MKLHYQAGHFEVHEHVRGKWVCKGCQTIEQVPMPAQIIESGMASAGLLAEVVVNKYVYHLPLHRQMNQFKSLGVDLSSSTLSEWIGACGAALSPLTERLKAVVKECEVLHADETPIKVLNTPNSGTRTGYVWTYTPSIHEPVKAVVYEFCDSRAKRHALEFLQSWAGVLITDDFSAYHKMDKITHARCMAHARRKFVEVFKQTQSPIADKALVFIQHLYQLEREAQSFTPEQRQQHREQYTKPYMQEFRHWLIAQSQQVSEGSSIAKAIGYICKNWEGLEVYLRHPKVSMDNNWAENQIRGWALGRKNWMFAGSLRAGQRAANIVSLLQSAVLNGHDPRAYLLDVLTRLPTHKQKDLDELLPHIWQDSAKNQTTDSSDLQDGL